MTERPPIPVDRLVQQVCDDGADFDDCVMGYTSGTFDAATETLTLNFERDADVKADEDDDWASATYRFQLVEENR